MKLTLVLLIPTILALTTAGAFWLWTPDRPRAELEARYLRAPDDLMEVAGLRLHVRVDGPRDAPSVIFLHGFGSSLHTWEAWAQALRDDHRVVRFDLPGSGLSTADPAGDYTDTRALEVLAALMDRLGIARASLVGNSIGGRIAWTFAALRPERVAKLVLVSPDGFASAGFEYGEAPRIPAAMKLLRFALPKALMRLYLAPAYGDPSALSAEDVNRYHDMMLAPGVRDSMIARLEQTVLVPPEPLLRRIQAPVLLVWGEKDAMIPVANADDYLRELPDAALAVLPGLGHVPHEEAPALSLPPVRAFLGP